MSQSDKHLDRLLSTTDSELCDLVWRRILDRHQNDFDISSYSKEEQVVDLVMRTWGIVDNGGFQYLFEGSFQGDPYFTKTVAAFRAIQANECADALQEELSFFPQSKPPRNIERRLQIYQERGGAKFPRKVRMRIGEKDSRILPIDRFFKQSREIEKLLANYIWQNRATFETLWD